MPTSFTPTSNWSGHTIKGGLSQGAMPGAPLNSPARDDEPHHEAIAAEERSFARADEPRPEASLTEAAVIGGAATTTTPQAPAYARGRKRSNSKAWMVALPAVLVGAGVVALTVVSGPGEEAATGEPVNAEFASLPAAPAAAESLPGMPMTDLGAPPAPVAASADGTVAAPARVAAPAPTVRRVSTRATAPAAPRQAAPERTEAAAPAASTPASETAIVATTSPAEVDLVPAAAPEARPQVEPSARTEPIIVTEPLAVPD